jgi:hypothetical protein
VQLCDPGQADVHIGVQSFLYSKSVIQLKTWKTSLWIPLPNVSQQMIPLEDLNNIDHDE